VNGVRVYASPFSSVAQGARYIVEFTTATLFITLLTLNGVWIRHGLKVVTSTARQIPYSWLPYCLSWQARPSL
jgi:hypothetical protein